MSVLFNYSKTLNALLLSLSVLLLAGCQPSSTGTDISTGVSADTHRGPNVTPQMMGSPASARSAMPVAADQSSDVTHARALAIKYDFTLENTADQLETAWTAIQDYCTNDQCVIESSSFSQADSYRLPRGLIIMRIDPAQKEGMISFLNTQGRLLSSTMSSQDLTDQVIDNEARLQNMIALRDRLRHMQTESHVSISDLLEIERTLTQTQSNIDSLVAQQKFLANETQKIQVSITLVSKAALVSPSTSHPILRAFNDILNNMSDSVAWLIGLAASSFPALVLLYIVYRLVRRRFMKSNK